MLNSSWQMNRIGLIDFWYYDEEEFYLRDGRMLLRGSNGSGKSVTMQSFIPLLLDGNMRPERLDPFGSRARKMENYLLEEGDEREERTGYLYMEFKRTDGENYLTVGIGMRARRNKKLDTWYFYINDGRRIGKDIFLYKDVDSKITYSKQELKNRIGEGGRVMESQTEYMESMNRLVFGFDTLDQYKELLELLIQLRTPKLSKDFKPTVINEILSSSLQTLSEDDLRPMSEAIENMDALKTNLDTLKDSLHAAKQIERVYDSYNQMVLYQKAAEQNRSAEQKRSYEKAAKDYDRQICSFQEDLVKNEALYADLAQEEGVLKKEKESLESSDAAKLKEQEISLCSEISEYEGLIRKKEEQESEKQEKYREVSQREKKQEEDNEEYLKSIMDGLEELEGQLGEIPFDEFAFMKAEIEKAPEEPYDFKSHVKLLEGYVEKVDNGIQILNQEKLVQERYDGQLKQVDELRRERDKREREAGQYRTQLQEIKSELVENIYQWNKANQELVLPSEDLQKLSRLIQDYDDRSSYSQLQEVVRKQKHLKEDELRELIGTAKQKHRETQDHMTEKMNQWTMWQEKKDPEPEQPEAVKRNRKRLEEMGIPYRQFYKTVDFDSSLRPEQASWLEETLLSMGILDALIIPSEYREQVLNMDKGVSDHYIFSDVSYVRKNIMEMLDVDNPNRDIFQHQNISRILCAIGYQGREDKTVQESENFQDSSTCLYEDGSYRLGIVEGTVTKEYEARYIGVQAREAYRQKMLDQLQSEYEELQRIFDTEESGIKALLDRNSTLNMEEQNFPSGTDLNAAARDYGDANTAVERTGKMLTEAQETLSKAERELTEIKLRVQEICQKTYLTARLDIFIETKRSLDEYKKGLMNLQIIHPAYLSGLARRSGLVEQLEDIDGDLDDIRYDLGRYRRSEEEKRKLLASVSQQLKLTDYEEIKDRLDHCIRRLTQIPVLREQAVGNKASLEEKLEQTKREMAQNEEKRIRSEEKALFLTNAFEAEYRLGYVELNFVITEDMEDQAQKVIKMLGSVCGSKKLNDIFGNVQEVYHQNRGYLLEYNLTLESLFEDMVMDDGADMPSMKRIDITGKYRGMKVRFKELIEKLAQDMEEQANLLSDKDRELFEDILANTISKKIRARIHASNQWVTQMNELMESMETSSGLKLNLKWKSRRAEQEEQMDTRTLVSLLQKDVEIMREEEVESLSRHFRSKIEEARKLSGDSDSAQSFHSIMREVLDYRKWFEFQLEYQKTGEMKKELTDRAFFTFSGGEKAMSMYVPLFSAVVAKYAGARPDAPRIISLDEAFAGVDEMNIKDMFRLMVNFQFNFIINSQILWGDYETVPAIAVYQLIRPENAKFVTVISYIWNGIVRSLVNKIGDQSEG